MSIVIQKYGGTSVGSVERMRHVADLIIAERLNGNHVAVVASAMAGATNQLVKLANQFHKPVGTAAYDFMVSTGENVSCGMLAMALQEKGYKALPLAGWQVPIYTNELHGRARITTIDTSVIMNMLNDGIIPVITGFQGVTPHGHITTLGRGGSDTSAVTIAAALKAERCDIYTDIDGMYTADPRLVINARYMSDIPFNIALPMAQLGAKVIHPRAVESAMESGIPLRILSSFGSDKVTTLSNHTASTAGGVAHLADCILMTVALHNHASITHIQDALSHADVPIDMLQLDGNTLQFSIETTDDNLASEAISAFCAPVSHQRYAKVSFIKPHAQATADQLLGQLSANGIEPAAHCADSFRVSVLVPQSTMEHAVNLCHTLLDA